MIFRLSYKIIMRSVQAAKEFGSETGKVYQELEPAYIL